MRPEIPAWIYIVFTAATSFGVIMQACILLGMFLGLRRLQGKIEDILGHVTEHALPLIASSRMSLEDLGPKLKIISENLVEVSETLKYESKNVKSSVDDVLEKTRAQTARVDEMVSGTLDGLTHAGVAIQHGIAVPLRQISGLLSGLKAGFGVLKSKGPVAPVAEPTRVAEEPESVVVIVEEVVEELASRRVV